MAGANRAFRFLDTIHQRVGQTDFRSKSPELLAF